MKYILALAIVATLASAKRAEAGLVIGSAVKSDSVYGPLGTLNLGKIFSAGTSKLADPGVEFTASDKVGQILNQDFVVISADLTTTTIEVAYDVSGGTPGHTVFADTWQFKFDNLTVASGAKIVGLTLLSNDGITVSSTGVTDNSISINVKGYSKSGAINGDNIRSVTYQIEFSNTVPEPSTFAMMAIGAVALLASRKWRSIGSCE